MAHEFGSSVPAATPVYRRKEQSDQAMAFPAPETTSPLTLPVGLVLHCYDEFDIILIVYIVEIDI